MTTFSRISTANTYDNAVQNLSNRQSAMSNQLEQNSAGKRVVRASDDPTGAAQAERALTRISRIATDQRALESQRNSIAMAESTLGGVTDALTTFRTLVVSAGGGTLTPADRKSIALQLTGLRDQIVGFANSKDTNGLPLFGALGSQATPFTGPAALPTDYTFQGLPGQTSSSEVAIPSALNGDSAFMLQANRDAVYNVSSPNSQLQTSSVTADPATGPATGSSYTITIGAVDTTTNPGTTTLTYGITESPNVNGPFTGLTASYPTTQSANIVVTDMPGLSLSITGGPATGDTIQVNPSPSLFSVLDNAIRDIGSDTSTSASASQAVRQALGNIDIGMARVSAVRGQAGDLLNRADSITANQGARSIQMEADRSRAEDLDIVKGLSDFSKLQTGYQVALQSYAQVQKLSLFNYIS